MIAEYEPGSVVLVSFPFTDRHTSKVRPALVLSSQGEDTIILGIFSRAPNRIRESWIKVDEQMEEFVQTGLKKS